METFSPSLYYHILAGRLSMIWHNDLRSSVCLRLATESDYNSQLDFCLLMAIYLALCKCSLAAGAEGLKPAGYFRHRVVEENVYVL